MEKRKAIQDSPLTKVQADELRTLHRKAMRACENHYQSAEFSHRRMHALETAETAFSKKLQWLESGDGT